MIPPIVPDPQYQQINPQAPDQGVSYPAHRHEACFALDRRSFWYQHRNRCIDKLLERYPPNGPIYDIGGGNGVVSEFLQQRGHQVRLIEPLWEGVWNAKRRGVRAVLCGTIDPPGFRCEPSMAAGLFDVLEHIEDDLGFLESLRALLPVGARIFLTVPARSSLFSDRDRAVGHFRRYDARSLVALLERSGFRVDYHTYLFSLLFPVLSGLNKIGRMRPRQSEQPRRSPDTGHLAGRPYLSAALRRALSFESRAVGKGRTIPIGTSLLTTATSS